MSAADKFAQIQARTKPKPGLESWMYLMGVHDDLAKTIAAVDAVLAICGAADDHLRRSFPDRMQEQVFAEVKTNLIRDAIEEALR